jgi:hypothetical protein
MKQHLYQLWKSLVIYRGVPHPKQRKIYLHFCLKITEIMSKMSYVLPRFLSLKGSNICRMNTALFANWKQKVWNIFKCSLSWCLLCNKMKSLPYCKQDTRCFAEQLPSWGDIPQYIQFIPSNFMPQVQLKCFNKKIMKIIKIWSNWKQLTFHWTHFKMWPTHVTRGQIQNLVGLEYDNSDPFIILKKK